MYQKNFNISENKRVDFKIIYIKNAYYRIFLDVIFINVIFIISNLSNLKRLSFLFFGFSILKYKSYL